tara:strand:+ start:11400 stop:12050 length:651 start_codon:yes stop_codon:yes gene_type:complete
MNRKTIAWEKWEEDTPETIIDPASFAPPEPEQTPEFAAEELPNDFYDLSSVFESIPKMVNTPMGWFQVNDKMSPSNQFDCWLGHSNFDITASVRDALEEIPGVEVLVILTRYRFFIGIGRMFSFRDVRVTIEKEILRDSHAYPEEQLDSPHATELVEKIKQSLIDYNHWAIFVFPNGEVDYVSADTPEDKLYKETLTLYRNAKLLTGGLIIKSDDK